MVCLVDVPSHLACDSNERNRVEHGISEARHEVGCAWPRCCNADANLASALGKALGSKDLTLRLQNFEGAVV